MNILKCCSKYVLGYNFFADEKDHLSSMSADIFKEITDNLSLKEMRALSLTGRNIFPIVDPLILLKKQRHEDDFLKFLQMSRVYGERLGDGSRITVKF